LERGLGKNLSSERFAPVDTHNVSEKPAVILLALLVKEVIGRAGGCAEAHCKNPDGSAEQAP